MGKNNKYSGTFKVYKIMLGWNPETSLEIRSFEAEIFSTVKVTHKKHNYTVYYIIYIKVLNLQGL